MLSHLKKKIGRSVVSVLSKEPKVIFKSALMRGGIAYWLGVPYWGRGFIPEAVKELMRSHFEEAKLKTLWGGYFDGNERSKRVLEKCGFTYHHTDKDMLSPDTNDIRTEHVMRLTKEEWMSSRLSG